MRTYAVLALAALALLALPVVAAEPLPWSAAPAPICSTHVSILPPLGDVAPAPDPRLTIICGNCSDADCVGKSIKSSCIDPFGFPGKCGAELTKCSDNRFWCLCQQP